MLSTLATILGWALLLLVALPALWTGAGAIREPPHAGGRARGLGLFLLGVAQAGAAVCLLGAL